ncbi:hypothetical protein AOQ84DRAFT_439847 [Glonium stellatum]|uniref:Uncharacterized protein n=1 Tax=Glonium stellatum TaxID=574774 RepID=A0A8E2F0I0_9PEZI|nr:hypothetical protein AOQ84DRAFT_439847 [Glonium stellatum]
MLMAKTKTYKAVKKTSTIVNPVTQIDRLVPTNLADQIKPSANDNTQDMVSIHNTTKKAVPPTIKTRQGILSTVNNSARRVFPNEITVKRATALVSNKAAQTKADTDNRAKQARVSVSDPTFQFKTSSDNLSEQAKSSSTDSLVGLTKTQRKKANRKKNRAEERRIEDENNRVLEEAFEKRKQEIALKAANEAEQKEKEKKQEAKEKAVKAANEATAREAKKKEGAKAVGKAQMKYLVERPYTLFPKGEVNKPFSPQAHSILSVFVPQYGDDHARIMQEREELIIDANNKGEVDRLDMNSPPSLSSQRKQELIWDTNDEDYYVSPFTINPSGSMEFIMDSDDKDESDIPVMIGIPNSRKIAKPKRRLRDGPRSAHSDSSTFSPHTSALDISTKDAETPDPNFELKRLFTFSLDTYLSNIMPSATTATHLAEPKMEDRADESFGDNRQSMNPKREINEVMGNMAETIKPMEPGSGNFYGESEKFVGFCPQPASRTVSWNSADSLASSWSNENSAIQYEDLVQQTFDAIPSSFHRPNSNEAESGRFWQDPNGFSIANSVATEAPEVYNSAGPIIPLEPMSDFPTPRKDATEEVPENSDEPELDFLLDTTPTQAHAQTSETSEVVVPSIGASPAVEIFTNDASVRPVFIDDTTIESIVTNASPIEEDPNRADITIQEERPTRDDFTAKKLTHKVVLENAFTGFPLSEIASLDAPINETVISKGNIEPWESFDPTNILTLAEEEPVEIIPSTTSADESGQVSSVGNSLAHITSFSEPEDAVDLSDEVAGTKEPVDGPVTFRAPTTSLRILCLPNSLGDITAAQSKAYDDSYLLSILSDDASSSVSPSNIVDESHTVFETLESTATFADKLAEFCAPTTPLDILSLQNSSVNVTAGQSKVFDELYLASILSSALGGDFAVAKMRLGRVDTTPKETIDMEDVTKEPISSYDILSPPEFLDLPRDFATTSFAQADDPDKPDLLESNTANTIGVERPTVEQVEFYPPSTPSMPPVLPISSSEVIATIDKAFDEVYLSSIVLGEDVADNIDSVPMKPINNQSGPVGFQAPTAPLEILSLPNSPSEAIGIQAKIFDEIYLTSILPKAGRFVAVVMLTEKLGLADVPGVQCTQDPQDGQARIHSTLASEVLSLPNPSTEAVTPRTPETEKRNLDIVLADENLDEEHNVAVAEPIADSMIDSEEVMESVEEPDAPQESITKPEHATRSSSDQPKEEPIQEQPMTNFVQNELAVKTQDDESEPEAIQESIRAPSSNGRSSTTLSSILPNFTEEEQLQLVQDDLEHQDLHTFLGNISLYNFLDALDCDDQGNTTKEAIMEAFIALAEEDRTLNEEFSCVPKLSNFSIDGNTDKCRALRLIQVRTLLGTTSLRNFLKLIEFDENGGTTEGSFVEAFQQAAWLEEERAMSSKARASAKRRAVKVVAGLSPVRKN